MLDPDKMCSLALEVDDWCLNGKIYIHKQKMVKLYLFKLGFVKIDLCSQDARTDMVSILQSSLSVCSLISPSVLSAAEILPMGMVNFLKISRGLKILKMWTFDVDFITQNNRSS